MAEFRLRQTDNVLRSFRLCSFLHRCVQDISHIVFVKLLVAAFKEQCGADNVIKLKIDRMIGILSVLLQKEKATAPCLAEKFKVSRRTVNRDIEALCAAGIPLITEPVRNGGVSGEVFEKRAASLPDLLRTAKM